MEESEAVEGPEIDSRGFFWLPYSDVRSTPLSEGRFFIRWVWLRPALTPTLTIFLTTFATHRGSLRCPGRLVLVW